MHKQKIKDLNLFENVVCEFSNNKRDAAFII
jgi:hypothetical protein